MSDGCAKCGTPHVTRTGHPACVAHVTGGYSHPERRGLPCRCAPLHGMTVCAAHGGRLRRSREAAERRLAEQAAAKAVATYGRPVETTAVEALLDEVKWTAGHVAWLRERVAELEERELTWGRTRVKEGGDDRGTTFEAGTNALLDLYQRERNHLVRVCAEAIKAGIEERRVRLAEQQGQLVADVIKAILADLGLSSDQQAKVATVVPLHLRRLAG